jgi:uncharacterized membrane protein
MMSILRHDALYCLSIGFILRYLSYTVSVSVLYSVLRHVYYI